MVYFMLNYISNPDILSAFSIESAGPSQLGVLGTHLHHCQFPHPDLLLEKLQNRNVSMAAASA